jgi:glucokinase
LFSAIRWLTVTARKWFLLSCAFMAEYSIGLDLGGTNLRAAAIDRAGRVLERRATDANPSAGREAMLGHMVKAITELRGACGSSGLTGIGIGVPGFILLKEGVIRNSNNLASLEDFPIRDEIERRLGARVILENDANAAALGEKWIGAGRDVDDLVMLTLGTGIGGGIISGGKVLHGYLGMAGEIGHITIVPTGNPCGCGNQGCLEKHASATAITAMANMLRLGENLSSREVYDLAVAGDEKARGIFTAVGQALGIALATLVNIFNFPLYLLSGGVLPAWDFFAPPMFEEVRRRSFAFRSSHTRIEKAILGNEAGLFGAACLPWVEAPFAQPALTE